MYCSPSRKGYKDVCLTLAELRSVAALFNANGGIPTIPQFTFKTREKLIDALNFRFKDVCGKSEDHCWIEQPIIKSSTLYSKLTSNYRPAKPNSWDKNKREWLNTYDILYVMKQYEEKYKNFEFLGVFPVDFANTSTGVCSINNMCDFSITKLKEKGKTKFATVLNLDKHNEPGSHWVACFCNLDPKSIQYGISYFDSGGIKPPKYIADFMKVVVDQNKEINPKHASKFKTSYNPDQKQFQNTECGVFSIFFTTLCLRYPHLSYRENRKKIKTDRHDNYVHSLRKYYWRPIPKKLKKSI